MPVYDHYFFQNKIKMGYKIFLPHNYESLINTFPVILFLHGIRKRGNDLSLLEGYGLTSIAEQSEDFPFIVIAPQCPDDTFWPENRNTVLDLLNQVINEYRVDRKRVYF